MFTSFNIPQDADYELAKRLQQQYLDEDDNNNISSTNSPVTFDDESKCNTNVTRIKSYCTTLAVTLFIIVALFIACISHFVRLLSLRNKAIGEKCIGIEP